MNYSQNGDKFIYPIYVENTSSYADTNVVTIISALPAGISYDSHTNTQGSFNVGTLTWTIPTLPGKTGTYLYLKVLVTNYLNGPFAIEYTSTGTLVDADLVDNTKELEATFLACSPAGGGVADFSGCLCIDVSTNDTKCTLGNTEWRLNEPSITNSETFHWDTDTGKGSFTPIDPTLPVTGNYGLWCVQGVDNYEISCSVAFTIYPQLEDKKIFDHHIDSVEYADLSLDDLVVLTAQHPGLDLTGYCWRTLRNSNGELTSGEPIDCNVKQDTKVIKLCSIVDCETVVNNCPTCPSNQLPADIQLALDAIIIDQSYEPEIGDVIIVQHPNASSDYEYTATGWIRSTCGCVYKISQDADNLLILGTDDAPYIDADILDDKLSKVSSNDTTGDYLINKLTAGAGITLTEINDAGNETLELSVDSTSTLIVVENNTAGVGSPNILTIGENKTAFTNTGASALNYHTLPTAAAGYTFTWVVTDATDDIVITANAGDKIIIAGVESTVAGTATSGAVGDSLTLLAVDSTNWVAISVIGTWTLA